MDTTLQLQHHEDCPVTTVLSSLPEHGESMDQSVRITSSSRPRSHPTTAKSALEESWNGLFLSSSISDLNSGSSSHVGCDRNPPPPPPHHAVSNKKMGHASFTDLGLYANHNPTSVLSAQAITAAKVQFMKLRLQRMLASRPVSAQSVQDNNNSDNMDRLHQSDSALLRKNSNMDTTELGQGAWYKARHPRHSEALEQLAHSSAPTGSPLDFCGSA